MIWRARNRHSWHRTRNEKINLRIKMFFSKLMPPQQSREPSYRRWHGWQTEWVGGCWWRMREQMCVCQVRASPPTLDDIIWNDERRCISSCRLPAIAIWQFVHFVRLPSTQPKGGREGCSMRVRSPHKELSYLWSLLLWFAISGND